jgi:prepilin-type N-terminal cleavage/methylation domain-containing protein
MIRTTAAATKRSDSNEKGFTLIEILIAMFVFTVMALAIARLSMNSWNEVDCSKAYTEAAMEASRQIGGLFSQRYTCTEAVEPNCIEGIGVLAGVTQGTKTPAAEDPRYQISYTVTNDAVAPDTKSIQMNVGFTCRGMARTVRYDYLLPKRR